MMNRRISVSLFLTAAFIALVTPFAQAQRTADYVITGRVYDESNRSMAGVWVFAVPDDYDMVRMGTRALSDANGNFRIEVGRPARYKLFPEKSSAGYFVQFSPFFRHPAVPIAEVVLSEAETTASAVVTLAPKNGVLAGKSIDAITGRPIEDARLLFCLASNPQVCWSTNAKNAKGEFRILTAHVPFTLTVMAQGYDNWFGITGFQRDEPISIASGTTMEAVFALKRRAQAVNRALNESEKQDLINLPAPVQTSPADRAELSFEMPRHMKLEWQPVEGAVSYKVEVDFCEGLVKSLRECINPQPHPLKINSPNLVTTTSYEFDFLGGQPGRWRVWAIDKNGQEGFKSPWRTFFHLK